MIIFFSAAITLMQVLSRGIHYTGDRNILLAMCETHKGLKQALIVGNGAKQRMSITCNDGIAFEVFLR